MDVIGSIELLRTYIFGSFQVIMPMMVVSLVIAVVFGVLQAVMQVQEQTLTFFPKLVGMIVVLYLLGPWMFEKMSELVLDYYHTIITLM
jgi:flagellar biosynthesis protein FliQ